MASIRFSSLPLPQRMFSGSTPEPVGRRPDQGTAFRVGIERQPGCRLGHRIGNTGCRRIGTLVGVQFDVFPVLGLLAGGVGFQRGTAPQ